MAGVDRIDEVSDVDGIGELCDVDGNACVGIATVKTSDEVVIAIFEGVVNGEIIRSVSKCKLLDNSGN